MAITSFSEIHDGRGGGLSLDEWESTRVFRVTTDSNYDSDYDIINYASCPRLASAHPSNPYIYVMDIRCDNERNSKRIWIVKVKYGLPKTGEGQSPSENPLTQPAEIEWGTEQHQEPMVYDRNGYMICNSAGDPFEEPITDEVSTWTVTIIKNVNYVPTWIDSYRDAVNSDGVFIDGFYVAAGTGKITAISIGKWQVSNKVWYRVFRFTIKIKYLMVSGTQIGWKKYVVDQGLRRVIGTQNPAYLGPCTTQSGEKATKPMLLDGSGDQLFNDTYGWYLKNQSDVNWITVDLRNLQAFSALPLS